MPPRNNPTLPNDTARSIAVNALLAFTREDRDLQDTLDAVFQSGKVESREKPLAAELALGSCRRLITLDHLIDQYSSRPLKRIEPLLLHILRVGLYQLLFLQHTPDFAAVDQAVRQAHQAGGKGAAGFINAVLRSCQRDMDAKINQPDQPDQPDPAFSQRTLWIDQDTAQLFKKNILPDPATNPAKYFSKAYAHPVWLVEKWLKRCTPQLVHQLCLANNSRPALTLRVNTLHSSSANLQKLLQDAGFSTLSSGPALQLLQPAQPDDLPGYHQGLFSVQDPAAMSVAPLLQPQPGRRILDLCAAPGGKTTHLAERMQNQGVIVACDVNAGKLQRIQQNCRRLGITIVQTCLPEELDGITAAGGPFDAILADVPCSNTGVLARRVEVRHRLKPVLIQRLAALQQQLLQKAVSMLKKDGRILYSTCSIEPAENESLIRKFLAQNPAFHLLSQRTILPGQEPLPAAELSAPALRHDGGFTALLA